MKAMEGSFVKLKIAEKEERMNKEREKKSSLKTVVPNGKENGNTGAVQKDGKYYLVRLEMELEKLKSMINEAESNQRLSQIPEEACGKIRNAVGKAQLLITKKFKQFEELCRDNIEEDPERRQNEMETKSSDLQGYWEMMFMQIDDVKALFSHIEKLKANNWAALEDGNDSPYNSSNNNSPKTRVKSSTTNKSSPARPRKKTKNGLGDDKVKKEAKSRLAAIRKQGKLRQQQSLDSENFIIINGTPNEQDLNLNNNSLPLDTSENGSLNSSVTDDASLNSSLNSSLEGLYDSLCTDNQQQQTASMLTREG